jgi:head-tail adaptor
MAAVAAGQLRARYSVRGRSTTRNSLGEREDVYTEKFAAWGEIPREGAMDVVEDPTFRRSDATWRLRFRYRTDFAIGDQLVDQSTQKTLYVTGVFPLDALRQWCQVTASESPVTPL